MQNVKFVISTIERENEIFEMVRKDWEFFKNNKIRFTWPEKPVEKEYEPKKYEEYKHRVETEWKKRHPHFAEYLLAFFHNPPKRQFTVEISNYGPLGFYNASKSTITINLNTHLDPIQTIAHEMVHIMLEPFIMKYNINYASKEQMVDVILKLCETAIESHQKKNS